MYATKPYIGLHHNWSVMQYASIFPDLKIEIFLRMFPIKVILDLQYWKGLIWIKFKRGNFRDKITFPDDITWLQSNLEQIKKNALSIHSFLFCLCV